MAGVSTALALWSRGAAVTLVDSGPPAHAATGASAGMLAPQYESPGEGPLYRAGVSGRAAWPAFARRLSELAGEELAVERTGMLVANFTDREEVEARQAVDWQRATGQAAEILSPGEAGELQDGLGTDAASWLWLPNEAHVDAQRLVNVFAAALRATSIRVLIGTPVREVAVSGGAAAGAVLEDGRRLSADRVVLAAGAWTGGLAHLPVRPLRGQMLRLPPGPLPLRRLVATHHGRYMVPRGDGSVLAGSTMEETGFDRSITEAGAAAIRHSCQRLVPAIMARKPVEQWADLRPVSSDGLPLLGPDPEVAGLFHVTGAGRNGILLGPLFGEIMAELVLGAEGGSAAGVSAGAAGVSAADLAALDPGRFGEGGAVGDA